MIVDRGDGETVPGGYGSALLMVNTNATVTMVGSPADSSAFVPEVAAVAPDGMWPVFKQLYPIKQVRMTDYLDTSVSRTNPSNLGCYIGWLQVSNGAISGRLKWIKTAVEAANLLSLAPAVYTNYYAAGFATNVGVSGLAYTQRTNDPTNLRLINITNALISFDGGNLPGLEDQAFLLKSNNVVSFLGASNGLPVVVKAPTNTQLGKLAIALDPKTGKVNGSFTNTVSAKPIVWAGAVLQPENLAYGYFLGSNKVGSVIIQKDPNQP